MKIFGCIAQFLAAILLVSENTPPNMYIPLAVLALSFGLLESMGVLAVLRI